MMKSGMRWGARFLAVSLSAALLAGAVGCGPKESGEQDPANQGVTTEGPHGVKYAADQTLRVVYDSEASTLNPGINGTAADWQAISNTTEGLLSEDPYGNYVPGLAERYEVSDDNTVYTFYLRQGLKWVDYKGEPQADFVAQDFVTMAEFICNPANASGSAMYFQDVVEGATAYLSSETTDFSTVGFKALDDHTLEITLAAPLPYFISYCGSYLPVPSELYSSLGAAYGQDPESMYFIGPYRITEFEPQSKRVYEKNESYWDAEHVYIEKVIMTYNAEGSTLAPEMFKRGEVDEAELGVNILDEWMKDPATKDIVLPSLPDTTYMYFYGFNYLPQFDAAYEPDNYLKAIDNENFRQSLYWGLDRVKAKMTLDPNNPELYLTNSITPNTWCNVDGKDFTEIGAMADITARPNWSFDPDKALAYKEAAVEELTAQGVTFPIKLLMPYNPVTMGWEQEVQVVKQQLEGLLGSDYIQCTLEAGPSTGFLAEVRRSGKYGFMKLNTGSTIDDPSAFIRPFGDDGNSWTFLDQASTPNVIALKDEYLDLIAQAKAITSKSMERYEAFARAEAFLLEHALVIPFSTDTLGGYTVSRLIPFEGANDSGNRYKWQHVLAEPLTTEQFELLYADWQAAREASLKAQ